MRRADAPDWYLLYMLAVRRINRVWQEFSVTCLRKPTTIKTSPAQSSIVSYAMERSSFDRSTQRMAVGHQVEE
jgi:hypothetical protein